MSKLQQLEVFIASLKARGAPQTEARYTRACRALLDRTGDTPLEQLTRHDIQRMLAKLHAEGLGPRTLSVTLSAWRSWFRYLGKTQPVFNANIFAGLKPPRAPKRLPNALTESEAMRLIEALPKEQEATNNPCLALRNQALFEILYGCGIRVGELVGLNVNDVDWLAHEVRVFGKGRKERIVPLGKPAVDAVVAWLTVRSSLLTVGATTTQSALFLGARGDRISPQVVRLALKQRAIAQGIASHVYPHRLRHSFASHVLQSSGDLRAVQELMGHASIASTQVYTHLDFQHLAKVYDNAHPRAHKKKRT